ncbi:MAG: methylenetetrahydrofolate reductase [NAD(P)H] [Solirubrobacterales bacterium]|nr:methylenetetrahydrofolate reductase [NAD(P)H] [Solirubrobacterales bacterium]
MRIDELIATSEEPVFSFEFFPPKDEEGEYSLLAALYALRSLKPTFVSVTWGAGGSGRLKTIGMTQRIRDQVGLEGMAHLTTVGATVEDLHTTLREMVDVGIENVLVLRGDPPRGQNTFVAAEGGLSYASELATLVADHHDLCVVGACYPEVHPESTDLASDLEHLRKKVDAGASVLITQLFFDNSVYEHFVEEARAAGIDVPIIPGIMPVTNLEQIKRFTQMCGASLPDGFRTALEGRAGQPEAIIELGVAYSTLQCADLLERGAPGIHFYTLNKSPATRAILSALRLMRPWERSRAYA